MKPKSRILSLLLAICLVVGLMPTAALAAGTDTGKAIQLVDSGTAANIDGYDSTDGYDYIYYGTWNDSAIKWRVLDDQTNTGENGLFLLSEELLGTGYYGGVYFYNTRPYSNTWQGSDAQAWCNTFASSNLDSRELAAILETTKSDVAFRSSTYSYPFAASENILNGDKVFSSRQRKRKTAHTVLPMITHVLPIMAAAPVCGGSARLSLTVRTLRARSTTLVMCSLTTCSVTGLLVPLLI